MEETEHRPHIGIFCLDLDKKTTASIGLFNYTKQLIKSIAAQPDPGLTVSLIVSEDNQHDLIPDAAPPWLRAVTLPGRFNSGFKRLWGDHVISSSSARRLHLDAMHFPKGIAPFFFSQRTRVVSTVADAIVFSYGKEFRSGISPLKRAYFQWMTKRALHKSSSIITISEYSKQALASIAPLCASRISVIYPGTGFSAEFRPHTRSDEASVVIMGSHRPHKATAETLELLAHYVERTGRCLSVHLVSISDLAPAWMPLPVSLDLKLHGRVADTELNTMISKAHAFVYLSRMEGFGLPCIEAYACGTPVCYRNTTALKEIMKGIPGGWDGIDKDSFIKALDEAISMPLSEVEQHRADLLDRFKWQDTAAATINIYRNITKPSRVEFGRIECTTHTIRQLLSELRELLNNKNAFPRSITCINAHIYNLASSNHQLRMDILASRIIAADGVSIIWASRLLEKRGPTKRCNMTDAFNQFLHSSDFPPSRAVVIGLSKKDAESAMLNINSTSTHCRVIGTIEGYLPADQYRNELLMLQQVDLVLVGMGSPKSERVSQIASETIPQAVVWHIGGGTLDMLSGKAKDAPAWMKKTGLQWLHRLLQEPGRLAGRYIIGNPLFVLRMIVDRIRRTL